MGALFTVCIQRSATIVHGILPIWTSCTGVQGWKVWGPLDILKETWEVGKKGCESVVSWVLAMQEKLSQRKRIFHINILRKWHTPSAASLLADLTSAQDEIPLWKEDTEIQDNSPVISHKLDKGRKTQLQALLDDFNDVLSDKPGRTNIAEHKIETRSASPVRLQPYRLPHAYRDTASPQRVTRDGAEWNNWALNERMGCSNCPSQEERWYPSLLPRLQETELLIPNQCIPNAMNIDELIDRLGQTKHVYALDLTRGYWQVPLAENAREKTAFGTPFGRNQFRVMPFGLHGAPATVHRMMDRLLWGLEGCGAAYLDDLVIYSNFWEEHLKHLRKVYDRLHMTGLTAKPKKCQFRTKQCVYLGHVVGNGMVKPELSKTEAVMSIPVPQTKKQVWAFLGITGYYCKLIPTQLCNNSSTTDRFDSQGSIQSSHIMDRNLH